MQTIPLIQRLSKLFRPFTHSTPRPVPPPPPRGPAWGIDHVSLTLGILDVVGWAQPHTADVDRLTFTWNSQPFVRVLPAPLRAGAPLGAFGFRAQAQVPREQLLFAQPVVFHAVERQTGAPAIGLEQPWAYALPRYHEMLPDVNRRLRAYGRRDIHAYRLLGATHYCRLRSALRHSVGKDFADCGRILEWGCGYGRLTRHLANLPLTHIVAVDSDRDSVKWCQQHLRFARVGRVAAAGPTSLPAGMFDLILARPQNAATWTELLRLCAPNGVVLAATGTVGPGFTCLRREPADSTGMKLVVARKDD